MPKPVSRWAERGPSEPSWLLLGSGAPRLGSHCSTRTLPAGSSGRCWPCSAPSCGPVPQHQPAADQPGTGNTGSRWSPGDGTRRHKEGQPGPANAVQAALSHRAGAVEVSIARNGRLERSLPVRSTRLQDRVWHTLLPQQARASPRCQGCPGPSATSRLCCGATRPLQARA